MSELVTCWRCPDHGLLSEERTIGRGESRKCGCYPTNAQCRKPVEPVVMAPIREQVERRSVEVRDDDLVLFWPNGDPAVKFQADGFLAMAHLNAHPLDTMAMRLGGDVVAALRDWCDARLGEAT